MSANLNDAVQPLRKFYDQLAAEVETDLRRLKVKEEQLKKLRATLKMLDAATTEPNKTKAKQSASKPHVVAAVVAVLTENQPQTIPGEDLKPLVKERLKSQGFDLVGAFRYWDKLLVETPEIAEVRDGVYGLASGQVSVVA